MKALQKQRSGNGHLKLVELTEPKIQPDDLKIAVAYSGICGSDVKTRQGHYPNSTVPIVLGHEFAGVVVDVGSAVTRFSIGDRVTSETTYATCGRCEACMKQNYNLCDERRGIGTQVNGSMATFVVSREASCHHLPAQMTLAEGALLEPLACCVHAALECTTITAGEVILVTGAGPIGLLMAQVIQSQGATVILSGLARDAHRLRCAQTCGIRTTVMSDKQSLTAIVNQCTNGQGVTQLFECSGASAALNEALPLVAKQGRVVQVGLFPTVCEPINAYLILQRELQYCGSRSQKPSAWQTALRLYREYDIQLTPLISAVYTLAEWKLAFDIAMKGTGLKILLASNETLAQEEGWLHESTALLSTTNGST